MSRPRVTKQGLDWVMECQEHAEVVYTADWDLAIEAAMGHDVRHHRHPVLQQLVYVGRLQIPTGFR